jgi:hypothetical protein
MEGLETAPFACNLVSRAARLVLRFRTMPVSFLPIDRHFWAKASRSELHSLNLQDLFDHIFQGHSSTAEAFLEWLPASRHADIALCEQAAHKLTMLQAPISYCNEDVDRHQTISSWAMANVPAALWVEFRNTVAWQRYLAEREAESAA